MPELRINADDVKLLNSYRESLSPEKRKEFDGLSVEQQISIMTKESTKGAVPAKKDGAVFGGGIVGAGDDTSFDKLPEMVEVLHKGKKAFVTEKRNPDGTITSLLYAEDGKTLLKEDIYTQDESKAFNKKVNVYTTYVVQPGETIDELVKKSLKARNIQNPTKEQIQEAKEEFFENNKDKIKGPKGKEYLIAGKDIKLRGEVDTTNNLSADEIYTQAAQDDAKDRIEKYKGKTKDYEVQKGDSYYKIAKEQLVQEGNKKPSQAEIIARQNELMALNPDKKRFLPGEKIKVPGEEAAVPAQNSKTPKTKTTPAQTTPDQTTADKTTEETTVDETAAQAVVKQTEEAKNKLKSLKTSDAKYNAEGSKIASQIRTAVTGRGTNLELFQNAVNALDEHNVVRAIEAYRQASPNESLLNAIASETGLGDTRYEAMDKIKNALMKRAESEGINKYDSAQFKNEFDTELRSQKRQIGFLDTKELDIITESFVESIHTADTVKREKIQDTAENTNMSEQRESVKDESAYTAAINSIKDRFKSAMEEYKSQTDSMGFVSNSAEWIAEKTVGSNETAEKVGQDLKKMNDQIHFLEKAKKGQILDEKGNKLSFEKAYYQVFGVDFDKNKILSFEKAKVDYQNAMAGVGTYQSLKSKLGAPVERYEKSNHTYTPENYTALESALSELYGGKEKLYKMFEDGGADFKGKTDAEKYELFGEWAKANLDNAKKNADAALDGKSFDEVQRKYERTFSSAFGTKNDSYKRVMDYAAAAQSRTMVTKAVAVGGAALLTVFTCGAGAPALTLALGSFGVTAGMSAGMEVLERTTNERDNAEDLSTDEIWNITKDAMIDGGIAGASVGLSKFFPGMSAKGVKAITQQMAKELGLITADGAIATGGDYLRNGEISKEGLAYNMILSAMFTYGGKALHGKGKPGKVKPDGAPAGHTAPEVKPNGAPEVLTAPEVKPLTPPPSQIDIPSTPRLPEAGSIPTMKKGDFKKYFDEVFGEIKNAKNTEDLASIKAKIDALQNAKQKDTLMKVYNKKAAKITSADSAPAAQETKPAERAAKPEKEVKPNKSTTKQTLRKDGTLLYEAEIDPATGNPAKRTWFNEDGKTISNVDEIDPATGNPAKKTWFYEDGKTISSVDEYVPATEKKTKTTWFKEDGKTISHVDEYQAGTKDGISIVRYKNDGTHDVLDSSYNTVRENVKTPKGKPFALDDAPAANAKPVEVEASKAETKPAETAAKPETEVKPNKSTTKQTLREDGTLQYEAEIDPATGNPAKKTWFNEDGKTISSVNEYDSATGKNTKTTWFKEDGKTISSVQEYDPATEIKTKRTWYNKDGKTINRVDEFDTATGKDTKTTWFKEDGKTISSVREFDPATGKLTKATGFGEDGKTISYIDEIDLATGKIAKRTAFKSDGKTIYEVREYDPATLKQTKVIRYAEDGKTAVLVDEYLYNQAGIKDGISIVRYKNDGTHDVLDSFYKPVRENVKTPKGKPFALDDAPAVVEKTPTAPVKETPAPVKETPAPVKETPAPKKKSVVDVIEEQQIDGNNLETTYEDGVVVKETIRTPEGKVIGEKTFANGDLTSEFMVHADGRHIEYDVNNRGVRTEFYPDGTYKKFKNIEQLESGKTPKGKPFALEDAPAANAKPVEVEASKAETKPAETAPKAETEVKPNKATTKQGLRDDGTLLWEDEIDPVTGNPAKTTWFKEDGKTISSVDEIDPATGKKTTITWFSKDGKTISSVDEIDPVTGKNTKRTYFNDDGKTINQVYEYDPATGKNTKRTWFKEDGKTIRHVDEIDPATGKKTTITWFSKDGKTISSVDKYDPATGKKTSIWIN